MTKPTLQKYVPTFAIDDGFRLTSEPTLEAITGDIRRWHEFSVNGADRHLFGAFMCGVALLRARDLVPRASRGATKKPGGYTGFDAWKAKEFGQADQSTLTRYMQFSENVFLRANDLGKTCTLHVLQSGYQDFECPRTPEDLAELMRQLGEVMDGVTMTMLYRSIKRIREAAEIGGDMGRVAHDQAQERGQLIGHDGRSTRSAALPASAASPARRAGASGTATRTTFAC
jgi:hypothetical protein